MSSTRRAASGPRRLQGFGTRRRSPALHGPAPKSPRAPESAGRGWGHASLPPQPLPRQVPTGELGDTRALGPEHDAAAAMALRPATAKALLSALPASHPGASCAWSGSGGGGALGFPHDFHLRCLPPSQSQGTSPLGPTFSQE